MSASNEERKENTHDSDVVRKLRTARFTANGRSFVIELLLMSNGCFIAVSEDKNSRMGAITLSVKSDKRTASSSSLIPERKGSMLASMVGEFLAEKLSGMAVVSLYLREEIDAETMKTLINEVRKLVGKDLVSSA